MPVTRAFWEQRFEELVRRKQQDASAATITGFETIDDRAATIEVATLGSSWTRERFDGWFYFSVRSRARSLNLVFVQSRDRNTVADDPSDLGGGESDKHLIYEGLSRVHAHAVLAGARTVAGSQTLFSVWHPELVALRASLGRSRHPVQVLVSSGKTLHLDDELIFNVPQVPVIIVTTDVGAAAIARDAGLRPWVHLISTGPSVDFRRALDAMAAEHGVEIVSAIGGRTTAARLMEGRLVDDLYLTTSPLATGGPPTPLYDGTLLTGTLVVRKRGRGREAGTIFEHIQLERT